jgi:hypothetical protein
MKPSRSDVQRARNLLAASTPTAVARRAGRVLSPLGGDLVSS